MTDRIQYTGENSGDIDPDSIDEVVHTGAVHFEMLSHDSAYLHLTKPDSDDGLFLNLYARAMTGRERRAARRRDEANAAALLARLFAGPPRVYWSTPWWRRPAALAREWWAWRAAAVLEVREE